MYSVHIHISDIHFGAFNPKRQYEILCDQFINKLHNIPNIDIISINGDLFDRKMMANNTGILYATYFIRDLVELARNRNISILLLAGTHSHDADQLQLFYHYLDDPTIDFRIIETVQFQDVKGFRYLCIPELYGIDEEIYAKYLLHTGWYDNCIIHGTIKGAVMGDNVGNGRLFTIDDFNLSKGPIFSGHIHTPGCHYGYYYYCGSPYRWKFGEEHEKGFIIYTVDKDTRQYYIHFEPIQSDTYNTIEITNIDNMNNVESIYQYIINYKEQSKSDFLRVKFNCYIDNGLKLSIRQLLNNNKYIKVEFLDNTLNEMAKNNMLETQYTYLLNKDIPHEQRFIDFVNQRMGYEFITLDRLNNILRDE